MLPSDSSSSLRAATSAALNAFAAFGDSSESDVVTAERLIAGLCHIAQTKTNPTDVLACALRDWNEQARDATDHFDSGFQETAVNMIASVLRMAVQDTTCDGPPRLLAAAFEMVFGGSAKMVVGEDSQDVAETNDTARRD